MLNGRQGNTLSFLSHFTTDVHFWIFLNIMLCSTSFPIFKIASVLNVIKITVVKYGTSRIYSSFVCGLKYDVKLWKTTLNINSTELCTTAFLFLSLWYLTFIYQGWHEMPSKGNYMCEENFYCALETNKFKMSFFGHAVLLGLHSFRHPWVNRGCHCGW